MHRWHYYTAIILVCSMVHLAQADMFDDARQSLNMRSGLTDFSGASIRGGASLNTGQAANTTLFRSRGQVGGTCGAFDFAASMRDALTEIPELFENLIMAILPNIPMAVLCYLEPTLCDIAKHFQALTNVLIQARYAQCQQIQSAMRYGGIRARHDQIAQCLEDRVNAGETIDKAMRICNGIVREFRLPGGGNGDTVNVVEESLGAIGASREMQVLARKLVGEVTMRTNNGGIGTDHERPRAALEQEYEGYRAEAVQALQRAVEEYRARGTVSADTLRSVSSPGQVMPLIAIQALADLQQHSSVYDGMLSKMAGGLGVVRLNFECQELQDTLQAAMDGNENLTTEQQRQMEQRLRGLQRSMQNILTKKEVEDRHLYPAVDALLSHYSAVQKVATEAGLKAPASIVPSMPFGRQSPIGGTQ